MPKSARTRLLVVGVKMPAESFIQRKLEGLAAAGMRVTMTTTSRSESHRGPRGVRIIHLLRPGAPFIARLARLLLDALIFLVVSADRLPGLIRALRSVWGISRWDKFAAVCLIVPLARLRPQIVHFEWINVAVTCRPLFPVWNCPVVVSCRGTFINVFPHIPSMAPFVIQMREALRASTAVHCVSEEMSLNEMLEGLDRRKIQIIHPAVDPQRFQPSHSRHERDGVFRIVTVSNLSWVKGVEYALVAVRKLRDSGVRVSYDLIGDGPEYQRVLYTVHDLALQDVVTLHGNLEESNVLEKLQQSDAFLLSSLSEGISNGVLEAMACSLPVVTSDCGGMREAVRDGIDGFVVPSRDSAAMAEALGTLAADPELRARIGYAARGRIADKFSLDRQIDQWEALYRAVSTLERRHQ